MKRLLCISYASVDGQQRVTVASDIVVARTPDEVTKKVRTIMKTFDTIKGVEFLPYTMRIQVIPISTVLSTGMIDSDRMGDLVYQYTNEYTARHEGFDIDVFVNYVRKRLHNFFTDLAGELHDIEIIHGEAVIDSEEE